MPIKRVKLQKCINDMQNIFIDIRYTKPLQNFQRQSDNAYKAAKLESSERKIKS